MDKRYIPSFLIFSLIFFGCFGGGLSGSVYSIRCLYLSIRLNKLNVSEKAVITKVISLNRTFNKTIYFSINTNNLILTKSMFKLSAKAEVGDEIEVIFNKKRNFFIIKNYMVAIYTGYIIGTILSLILFCLSFLFGRGLIAMYKEMIAK
jgi:hypothetical protein